MNVVAIIGCGRIANYAHFPALNKLENVRIKYACDIIMEKAEKELEHLEKFLAGVRAKLSNERFTAHAPEAVVAMERKKEADALSKIEILETKIKQLKNNK